MKYFLKTGIKIFFICLCILTFFLVLYHIQTPKEKKLHVFLDVASGPTLLQMIDFIRLPKTDKKIIAWERNRQNNPELLSKYNACEIKYIPIEAHKKNSYLWRRVLADIREELKKDPNIKIVFYTNLYHVNVLLFPILQRLSPKNIQMIHLYEDGYGNIAASRFDEIIKNHQFDPKLKPKQFKKRNDAYYLGFVFPTVFHISFSNYIQKHPKLKDLYFLLQQGQGEIQDVDFKKIKQSLTKSEKNDLKHLLNLDADFYQKLFQKSSQKTAFFLSSAGLSTDEIQKEARIFKKIYQSCPYTVFLKPHPASSSRILTQILQKDIPQLFVIPSHIPVEAFYLTDCLPDYLMGYGSSVFLSMPLEKMLFYIKRIPKDTYLPFLLNTGLIRKEQIISLETEEPSIFCQQP